MNVNTTLTTSNGSVTYYTPFEFFPNQPLVPIVNKIIINGKKVVVLWKDGERTVSTCGESDIFDPEIGFCIALAKKIYGKKKYQRMLKKAEVQDNNDKLLKKFKKNTIDFQKED